MNQKSYPLPKIVALFLLFFLASSAMWAQDRQITGKVSDATGPIPGVNILVKGTTTGTATDDNGDFTLNLKSGDNTLVISATGYATQEIEIGTQTTLTIALSESDAVLDEVIVTGYATESKRQTTGAVSIVKARDLKAIPSSNVEQQLQGRVTGVTVLTNGQPGSTSQIRVRGFGAFGGNQPLYIVDGVPVGSTDFLSPDDIETSTVLKDAASASIYGARAANGVIVFTTKKGSRKSRGLQVSYDGFLGVTDPNVNGAPKLLSPQEQADYTHIAYRNNAAANGVAVKYEHPQYGTSAQATLPDYLHANGQNGVRGSIDLAAIQKAYEASPGTVFLIKPNLNGTNWYDEITRTGLLQRHSLGFSGGSEKAAYYLGLSLQNLEGILLNNDFERYSFRANTEFDITKWLKIGQNLQFTYRSVIGGFGGEGGIGGADDESVILSAYRMPTVIPVFDEFGSYASTKAGGFNNPRNPVRQLQLNDSDDKGYNANGFGNVYLEINPIRNLTLRSSLGGQYNNFYFVNYNYKYLGDSEPEASNTFSEGSGYFFQYVFTNTASYKLQLGSHGVTALGGIEALNTGVGRNISGSGINPFSTDLDFQNLSTVSTPQVNSGLFNGVNIYSLFGKLDYNFNEKYYLTGVIRRDGSSQFGPNTRFGIFPAVSAAWRVTSEKFMQNIPFITDLKIRGGWGEMGNSNNVNPANQFSLYASNRGNSFYPINGQGNGANEGFFRSRIGNPDAKWETSETANVGIDVSMLNNRLEVIADVWRKDTRDLLFQVPLAGVTGNSASAPAVNIANMRNQGIEVQIINRGKIAGDWSYEITLNNSFLQNEITYLAPGQDFFGGGGYRGINPIRNQVGQPLSSFFGYKVLGYFESAADVTGSPTQAGAGVGRFKYADLNSYDDSGELTGQPDGIINEADRTFIGNPIPTYTGGYNLNVTYKRFSLTTYWFASVGNEIFNMSKWFTDFHGTFEGSGKGERAKDSWTPELGNSAKAPIWESASNTSTSGASNSWYVEDGSFLRLQQIALSYDLDQSIVDRIGLSRLRFGIAANNIFTITKYDGLDPMVGGGADTNFGIDVGNYPATRGFTFSLGVGF